VPDLTNRVTHWIYRLTRLTVFTPAQWERELDTHKGDKERLRAIILEQQDELEMSRTRLIAYAKTLKERQAAHDRLYDRIVRARLTLEGEE